MKFYTIGYGGRNPKEFINLLELRNIKTVADVRLRPDRASMGVYAKANSPDKGIQRILSEAGISYVSLVELGNVFLDLPDYAEKYRQLLEMAGDLLTQRLLQMPGPICLMCAEKNITDCHRLQIAEYLVGQGHEVEHIQ